MRQKWSWSQIVRLSGPHFGPHPQLRAHRPPRPVEINGTLCGLPPGTLAPIDSTIFTVLDLSVWYRPLERPVSASECTPNGAHRAKDEVARWSPCGLGLARINRLA
jgi:hypothetical protein